MRVGLLAWAVFLGPLAAQNSPSIVHVSSDPPGLSFVVDGQIYSSLASFLWPPGSPHVLSIAPFRSSYEHPRLDRRFKYEGWVDSSGGILSGGAETVTVTADPSLRSVTVRFSIEYRLLLTFFRCSEEVSPCPGSPGVVYVNGTAYDQNAEIWLPLGAAVEIRAAANPGFSFAGWNNTQSTLTQTFVMDGSRIVYPRFVPAVKVRLETSPSGLKVVADGTPVTAPYAVEWGLNTQHTLRPVTPQADPSGAQWVFESWSNGGTEQQVYTVPSVWAIQTVAANFVPGARAMFFTNPNGLKLEIDGRENWRTYDFVWAVGSAHIVSAPLEQTIGGRRFAFKGWSNGGDALQQIAVDGEDAASGIHLIARYEALGKLTIDSSPVPVTVQVDGAGCLTPCAVDRAAGTGVRISTPASVMLSESTRIDFDSWPDGASRDRTWTASTEAKTITAVYRMSHLLRTQADPPEGAAFRFDPASPDGFYADGTAVTIVVEPRPGYRFKYWGGDLSGTFSSGTVRLNQPRTVTALLDSVPYIAPAGVRNAAGETPEAGVAASSIISIYGTGLARSVEAGPVNPLAQTLAGVTVELDGRLLALFYVSPEQINALLASDLKEGAYKLTVHPEGEPEISASFDVVRNAPGLFAHWLDSRAFAAALHEDGTAIWPESPARRGEAVTFFGTGFGPHKVTPPDGFPVPEAADFPLADPVEILAGDLVFEAEWAGAAHGHTGVTAIRFRIGDTVPGPATVEIRMRVNGKLSNAVLLPVE